MDVKVIIAAYVKPTPADKPTKPDDKPTKPDDKPNPANCPKV